MFCARLIQLGSVIRFQLCQNFRRSHSCLYPDRVSDGTCGPPDPSLPWHPVHCSRKMRAPALRSSSLAFALY